jgi:hypothetical protein
MPRRSPPRYREALDAIHRMHSVITRLSEAPRLPQAVRAELRTLAAELTALVRRDNGRR